MTSQQTVHFNKGTRQTSSVRKRMISFGPEFESSPLSFQKKYIYIYIESSFESDSKLSAHRFATLACAVSIFQNDLFEALFTGARIIRVLLAFANLSRGADKTDLLTFRNV